jgi:hypothetical protein
MDLFNQTESGAIFSECKKYRYALWRVWDKSKPYVMFIGLNPSTANELTDDPTIRRVKKLAYFLGYGGVYMMNLYAFITPDPKELKKCNDPIKDNDKWINTIHVKCKDIIFAWGSFKAAKERGKYIVQRFKGLALGLNNDGSPKHPLYIPNNVQTINYTGWTPRN